MSAAYSVAEIQRILNPIFTAHGVRRAVLEAFRSGHERKQVRRGTDETVP